MPASRARTATASPTDGSDESARTEPVRPRARATAAHLWAAADRLAQAQDGVISRRQLLGLGLTPAQARAPVDSGRWRTSYPGVYFAFSGPVATRARIWSALLYAGEGAVVSGEAALWLAGLRDQPPGVIVVAVPVDRRVAPQPGLRVMTRRSDPLPAAVGDPPRLTIEHAVLDVADSSARAEAVIALVLSAVARRLTTADRLRAVLASRPRHRWRALVRDLLDEAADGVQSALEHRFVVGVERAHGLPHGVRQRAEPTAGGRRVRYRDLVLLEWSVVVELDGEAAHPQGTAFRDRRRDNAAVVAGWAPLRYGWHEVVTTPCEVAREVAEVLRRHGWSGRATPCGPTCAVGPSAGRQ